VVEGGLSSRSMFCSLTIDLRLTILRTIRRATEMAIANDKRVITTGIKGVIEAKKRVTLLVKASINAWISVNLNTFIISVLSNVFHLAS